MNLYEVYSLYDVTPVRAQGCYVYDQSGREYLDFYGGHAVISIGHSHPHYIERITNQLHKIGFYSNSIRNPLQEELAEKLGRISGFDDHDLFLINSGAEANENALKLASFHNGRTKILALENSFHGRTSAAINVTQTGLKHQAPLNKGFETNYCSLLDTDQVIGEIKTESYAAIIIEGIQGVGGLDMISDDALRFVRKVCHETNTLLILDEVQCGYGRSGDFYSFQKSGIVPDLVTIAKGMGNGFPVGGLLVDATKIPAVKSRLGTTYGGNHLACAASLAVLEVIENENLVKRAREVGMFLKGELNQFEQIVKLKGRGLMLGAEFSFPVAELRKSLIFNQGLFTGSSSNPNLLRLLPPLTIGKKEVSQFITKLREGLQAHLTTKSESH